MPSGPLYKSVAKRATISIERMGAEITVERPDGTATENDFGKVTQSDVTWEVISNDEVAYRSYGGNAEDPSKQRASGGRVSSDSPNIMFSEGGIVQEGDRVTFPDGETYEVDRLHDRGVYYESSVTKVNT